MDQYKVIAKETYLSLMVFLDFFIRGQSCIWNAKQKQPVAVKKGAAK